MHVDNCDLCRDSDVGLAVFPLSSQVLDCGDTYFLLMHFTMTSHFQGTQRVVHALNTELIIILLFLYVVSRLL